VDEEDRVVDPERDEEQEGDERDLQVKGRPTEQVTPDPGPGADRCERAQGVEGQQEQGRDDRPEQDEEDHGADCEDERDDEPQVGVVAGPGIHLGGFGAADDGVRPWNGVHGTADLRDEPPRLRRTR
jgi:hypothetical protein